MLLLEDGLQNIQENKEYRGYHMPQTIFARIPLTIDDAVNQIQNKT